MHQNIRLKTAKKATIKPIKLLLHQNCSPNVSDIHEKLSLDVVILKY